MTGAASGSKFLNHKILLYNLSKLFKRPYYGMASCVKSKLGLKLSNYICLIDWNTITQLSAVQLRILTRTLLTTRNFNYTR